jgi:hypothetical protein
VLVWYKNIGVMLLYYTWVYGGGQFIPAVWKRSRLFCFVLKSHSTSFKIAK